MTYKKNPVPFTIEPDNLRILGSTVYLCTNGKRHCHCLIVFFNTNRRLTFRRIILIGDLVAGDAACGWDNTG
jgi:hypothetical protein